MAINERPQWDEVVIPPIECGNIESEHSIDFDHKAEQIELKGSHSWEFDYGNFCEFSGLKETHFGSILGENMQTFSVDLKIVASESTIDGRQWTITIYEYGSNPKRKYSGWQEVVTYDIDDEGYISNVMEGIDVESNGFEPTINVPTDLNGKGTYSDRDAILNFILSIFYGTESLFPTITDVLATKLYNAVDDPLPFDVALERIDDDIEADSESVSAD